MQVTTQYNGNVAAPASVALAPVAPALFTLNDCGSGQAAAINQNSDVNGAANPANAGSYVSLYATGLGQTNPGGQDGVPTGYDPAASPADGDCTVGGKPATVQYAGGAPGLVAGVIQVNVQIPSGLTAGAAEVILKVGSVTSPHGVTIAVSGN